MTTIVNREYRLKPLRTSSTMAARSHSVDFRNCLRSNFRRELHRLSPPPVEWPFPIRPAQDRLTLWCRECVTDNPCKGQCRFGLFQRMYEGFSSRVRPLPFWQSMSPMEEEPPTRLISAFYCMARVDTCHPCDCMRSYNVHASYHLKITCPSKKDLGYNI